MPTLKVAIQYEDAELGTFDNNPDGGCHIVPNLLTNANKYSNMNSDEILTK